MQLPAVPRANAALDRSSAVDARMVALMRALLSVSALAIIYVDPTEPARMVEVTYASLSTYCVWSLLLLLRAGQEVPRNSPWIDVAWATYLVALTQGTSSIFFFLFMFAILVASFSGGFRRGIAVTLASTILFTLVGAITAPTGEQFELNRTLIRPIYMLGLGWLMAVWGGRELTLRRRLAFLRDVSAEWNPRQGAPRTILDNLSRMVAFFGASECLLVVRKPGEGAGATVYKASAGAQGGHATTEVGADGAALLLGLPGQGSTAFAAGDTSPGAAASRARELASLLDAPVYASVECNQVDGRAGRLFVTRQSGPFDAEELAFVEQLALALAHVVENTKLIDELVLKAGEHERFRISLDIHDSTVQPYIGLKLGLDALYREAAGNPMQGRVADLVEMADATIRDLRGFATGVRERAPMSGDSLVKAVREQAERFQRFYGVAVHVECDELLFVSPLVASEAFRMISEGLSNVMRHTTARNAYVRVSRYEKELRLTIANESWGAGEAHKPFTPRSINARALSLGGSSFVEQGVDGRAAVHVGIPV